MEYGNFSTIYHPWITKLGSDGKFYSNYGIGHPLIEVPFYLIGKLVSKAFKKNKQYIIKAIISLSSNLIISLVVLIFFKFASKINNNKKINLITSIILAFATMIFPYSKQLYRDPPQLLMLFGAFFFLFSFKKSLKIKYLITASCFLGFALTIKFAIIIYLPSYLFYLLLTFSKYRKKIKYFLIFITPICIGILISLIYNYIRFNNFLDFGYTAKNIKFGLKGPFIEGIWGLLLSSGKGFFTYSPVLILFFPTISYFYKKFKAESIFINLMVLTAFIFYSKYWSWGGGWCWGPRYLLPLIPLMMLPILFFLNDFNKFSKLKKSLVVFLIILSFFVQLLGIFIHHANYLQFIASYVHIVPLYSEKNPNIRSDLFYVDFVPQFSPIIGHWWLLKSTFYSYFHNKEQTNFYMRESCPWKSINSDWVPQNCYVAIQLGFDLLFLFLFKYFTSLRLFVILLLILDILLIIYQVIKIIKYLKS